VIEQLVIFLGAVALFAIIGVRVGMLVAPRLGRMSERMNEPNEEDAGDGVD